MSKKHKNLAYDFDGVASTGLFEDGAYIITGEPESENGNILEALGDKKPNNIFNYPTPDELDENTSNVKIGIWKARVLKGLMRLGVDKYYEDTEDQINIIREMNPKLEVIKVIDGVPQEKLNFIVFTYDGTMLPIAHKLEKEGNRVIVGMIHDKKRILLPEEEYKPENPEKKEQRLSLFDNLIEKYSADEVLKIMKRIKDKENWVVLTDSNSNFYYTELALEMGYSKGIFPLQEDREMEVDRKKAKDFVKEHYEGIEVAEVKTFKTVEEGIQFLNDSDDLWVLKSQGDAGDTIVSVSQEPEIARDELIAALEEMKGAYEENGFLFEPRIIDPIELTPELIFCDGVPVQVSLNIELKNIAQGSAVQTGCMANLIVKTDFEDRINKIAFPEIVHEMAKKRKGIFAWDLSILIDKKGKMFFGEYCSQRFGWDSFPTDLTMSADDEGSKVATPFFSSLLHKKNPMRKKFGFGVRMLNIGSQAKLIQEGTIQVKGEAEACVYLYEVKADKEGKLVSTSQGFDFSVATAASDNLYEAIEKCYEYVEMVMFEGKFFRSRSDIMDYGQPDSIMRRFDYAQGDGLIGDGSDDNNPKTIGRNY